MEKEKVEVLFVDDEENVITAVKRAVFAEPYTCYFASSGSEALHIMADKNIDIIIADMKMPNMSGLELMKKVADSYPSVVKIIISGYAQIGQVVATVNSVDLFKFILKPFEEQEVHETLLEAVEYAKESKEKHKLVEALEKQVNELKTQNEKYKLSIDSYKVLEETNLENIQNEKMILSKFFKNLNYLVAFEKDSKFLNLTMLLEQLYEVYVENLNIPVSIYTGKDVKNFLKSSKTELVILSETSETRYLGNIGLIRYLITEIVDYMYVLTEKRKIDVQVTLAEEEFQVKFILPLGSGYKDNANILMEKYMFPEYIDFAKYLLKFSGINLEMQEAEAETQVIMINMKR